MRASFGFKNYARWMNLEDMMLIERQILLSFHFYELFRVVKFIKKRQ